MKNKLKILFVISNDFGEIYNALYFAEGLTDRQEILFLLPEKLYKLNSTEFPYSIKKYTSFVDLKKCLNEYLPHICLLFSGYLFNINNIFSDVDIDKILKLLKKINAIVISTDPWLNIWSGLNTLKYRTLNLNDPRQASLIQINNLLKKKYKDIYHIYTFPFEDTPEKYLGFYNKKVLCEKWWRNSLEYILEFGEGQFWLFIISSEDVQFFNDKYDLFIEKLNETIIAGRKAVLIAPAGFISLLKNSSDVVIYIECSWVKFRTLLYRAEFVFYWNIFSATILPRLVTSKPVFYFDFGHMARYFPPFMQLGCEVYYNNLPLPFLNMHEKLLVKNLKKISAEYKGIYKYFQKMIATQPSSEKLINDLRMRIQ